VPLTKVACGISYSLASSRCFKIASSFSVQNIFYDTDLGIHPRVDWADLACLWLNKGNEMVQLASPVKTIQKWIEIQFYYNTNTKLA
jgi:hypothetical protein